MAQLAAAFMRAADRSGGRRASSSPAPGRSFVAGADIRFFIRNIERQELSRTMPSSPRPCKALLLRDSGLPEAGRRAPARPGARRRRRAGARLRLHRRHAERDARVSRDRHRHLSRSRRHAADDAADRRRTDEVAGVHRADRSAPRRRSRSGSSTPSRRARTRRGDCDPHGGRPIKGTASRSRRRRPTARSPSFSTNNDVETIRTRQRENRRGRAARKSHESGGHKGADCAKNGRSADRRGSSRAA